MKVIKELFLFGFAGALGFLVDAGILYLMKPFIGLYFGRLVSFFGAVVVTWVFNRSVTFAKNKRERNIFSEFFHYFSLMIIGGLFNLAVYYFLIHKFQFFTLYPVAAVAMGSVAGMAVNFLSSRIMFYGKK